MLYASSKLVFTGFRGTHRDVPPAVETQKDHVEHEGGPNLTWRNRSMAASHTFILCSQNCQCPCIPNVEQCHTKLP